MGVRLEVDGSDLVVTMTGFDWFWALRRRFRIPLVDIGSARTVARRATRRWRWRILGTNLPGVIVAGRYRSRGRWEFWCVGAAALLLEIACPVGKPYDLVYLQVPEPERAATWIRVQAGVT